ncbi:hypothetical protein SK128_020800 [Halocaridina rubra]|uniref:Uncharacterized protein n=1 Tax=Halocaridina rubra TaxID=373956 RepID=A0AAN8ZX98_HALRR
MEWIRHPLIVFSDGSISRRRHWVSIEWACGKRLNRSLYFFLVKMGNNFEWVDGRDASRQDVDFASNFYRFLTEWPLQGGNDSTRGLSLDLGR